MEKSGSNVIAPQQVVMANMQAAKGKTEASALRLILLGMFAGMFIAGGASVSNVAVHAIANAGVAKLVAGAIFPVGLMLIILVGGELFTGDCLMVMGCAQGKFSALQMVKVLVIVYFSNLAGAVLFAAMVSATGQFNLSSGLLGAYTIKVAMGKLGLSFGQAFVSGILCNIFVCAAVLLAAASKDVVGKIWGVFFPIMTFVVCGFEHCVANMYYIPAAMMAVGNETYAFVAMEVYGYTAAQLSTVNLVNFITRNLIPVTLGNIVGGMVFIGLPLFLIHGKAIKASEEAAASAKN